MNDYQIYNDHCTRKSFKSFRSTAANVCLSISDYPREMDFDAADVFGGVIASDHSPGQELQRQRESISKKEGHSRYKIQCLPIYSLILAAGNPTVDYLSLDIEGAEIKVTAASASHLIRKFRHCTRSNSLRCGGFKLH